MSLRRIPRSFFRQAGKGRSITVLKRDLYSFLVLSMLHDDNTYRRVHSDPTVDFKKSLEVLLLFSRIRCFVPKTSDYLYTKFPIIHIAMVFQRLTRVCFSLSLRPIISGIGSLCEGQSEWVDGHLQPLVHGRPHFLWDSKHALQYLHNTEWSESYSISGWL